jgi:hypothetical protein
LNVGNLANEYYKIYNLTNSDTYSKYKVDDSKVSEDAFNISDIGSALETMEDTADTDFSSIGNLSSYTENAMKLSQSSIYSDLSSTNSSIISNLISGNTDDSSIYGVLTKENENLTSSISDVIKAYGSGVSSYSEYLGETGLDTSV